MRYISFISIHPQIFTPYINIGVFAAAAKKVGLKIQIINLRDFAVDKHGSIDALPYGGGDSMVFRPEPLVAAITAARQTVEEGMSTKVIYPSPKGRVFSQSDAQLLSAGPEHLIFICARFAGIDQRIIDHYVDEEISLGDYVVAGGELPSLLIAEAALRLIPEVLGNELSALNDSFGKGNVGSLEAPTYTRPLDFEGKRVPEALVSGNHQAIKAWREEQSRLLTQNRRPDLASKRRS